MSRRTLLFASLAALLAGWALLVADSPAPDGFVPSGNDVDVPPGDWQVPPTDGTATSNDTKAG